jgi:hypothetical protein
MTTKIKPKPVAPVLGGGFTFPEKGKKLRIQPVTPKKKSKNKR